MALALNTVINGVEVFDIKYITRPKRPVNSPKYLSDEERYTMECLAAEISGLNVRLVQASDKELLIFLRNKYAEERKHTRKNQSALDRAINELDRMLAAIKEGGK